jgi:hypothetical protein
MYFLAIPRDKLRQGEPALVSPCTLIPLGPTPARRLRGRKTFPPSCTFPLYCLLRRPYLPHLAGRQAPHQRLQRQLASLAHLLQHKRNLLNIRRPRTGMIAKHLLFSDLKHAAHIGVLGPNSGQSDGGMRLAQQLGNSARTAGCLDFFVRPFWP